MAQIDLPDWTRQVTLAQRLLGQLSVLEDGNPHTTTLTGITANDHALAVLASHANTGGHARVNGTLTGHSSGAQYGGGGRLCNAFDQPVFINLLGVVDTQIDVSFTSDNNTGLTTTFYFSAIPYDTAGASQQDSTGLVNVDIGATSIGNVPVSISNVGTAYKLGTSGDGVLLSDRVLDVWFQANQVAGATVTVTQNAPGVGKRLVVTRYVCGARNNAGNATVSAQPVVTLVDGGGTSFLNAGLVINTLAGSGGGQNADGIGEANVRFTCVANQSASLQVFTLNPNVLVWAAMSGVIVSTVDS